MKTNELRIGNIINKSGDICVLASINVDDTVSIFNDDKTDTFGCFALRIFKPVPLTKEWLLKLGFINEKDDKFYHEEFDRLYCEIDNPLIKHLGNVNGILKETEYVHQLQNMFFALTETELTVK